MVQTFVEKEQLPIRVFPLEGTYLQWLDFRDVGFSEDVLIEKLIAHDVFLSNGSKFGDSGDGFMRMNLACPQSILEGCAQANPICYSRVMNSSLFLCIIRERLEFYMKNIVVIGGGPSGMMAAISAKINHPQGSCYIT
ncbi:hypothetical protein MX850_10360 [Erysipelothrix sp. Poltava]|nr:hypothetical protein MX850_10360 [Erysipelothrix sp. Poltava]